MAIDFSDVNRKILAVNIYIYMPCDDRSTPSLNYDEFIKYLGLVDAIIKESDISSVFVIGDWNAGVHSNCVFGSELSTFCTEHSYIISDVDRLGCCSDSFTFLSEAHGTTSWIDHRVSAEQAHSSITDVNICYDMPYYFFFGRRRDEGGTLLCSKFRLKLK